MTSKKILGYKEIKYDNKISDIKVLEKVKFNKLEILNLSVNQITDINILEKVWKSNF